MTASAIHVIPAGPRDATALAEVIAGAFHDLPPSRWLIPDPAARQAVFPAYFRLLVDHALAAGRVTTTRRRDAAALWIPAGAAPLPGHDERLASLAGDRLAWFRDFDAAMEARHPAGDHDWLAILAVAPGRQCRGTGSALLAARHAVLDRLGTGAYLEAASPRARELYLRHGYADHGPPVELPGPQACRMYPMWRAPRPVPGPA